MMGFISCYNELTVQVSESKSSSSCSSYNNVNSSCVSPNLIPAAIQTAATNLYKTTLSTGDRHVIAVTWCRNSTTQGLQINSGDDPATAFRLNTNSRLFRKKKGSKAFEIGDSKFEVFYDLSAARYAGAGGAEPVEGYYVLVMVDSELGLFIGDLAEEAAAKKVKNYKKEIANFNLISRREHFYGNTLYSTKARFSDAGICHDIVIRCTGDEAGEKGYSLSVCIDKRVMIRVKRLQWNFRGNQTIFVDGLSVDLMWDVHDWFFGSGSGSGSGHGVFMFRTRNGLDSRLWLEEKVVTKKDDEKKEFSLLVYATKS
ncbi:hypothetical protein OSB04_009353 [Centaurea solstitialis]|uniref:DUF868 family protein n=1 Tax=Centaurea solstitialis TaxID=347529 RepID=A0AA38T759_9ASTR|nr:hypothetical protein OSB04_009353 [Centaurea solstitialis]